ncbi:MAG: 50S ribosomal protein L4 [Candidatus Liptonbacteria bacterium]|nr:50S ribosomal protein L4 [Candidatus Liptonbacteria bacterium]
MKTIDVVNLNNEKTGTMELPEHVFGVAWNETLVHEALVAQDANARRPIAHAKGRGEVRGGGKKPWRQKGTGRARHGSIRSPLWVGGGVTHGPSKERVFAKKMNKKAFRKALFSALSRKVNDGEFTVIDTLDVAKPKTKEAVAAISRFFDKKNAVSALLVPRAGANNIVRAARNIPHVKSISSSSLNVRDILAFRRIFADQAAIGEIASRYASSRK